MRKGRLISLEGLDGAGKTTQISLLERWLKKCSIPYECTQEPGGTELGRQIRDLLLNHPELPLLAKAEAFLFAADRAQHFAKRILPALEEGKLVITDRCFDSSIAYQGFARGLDTKHVEELSLLAMQRLKPDLTILLDLDPKQVQTRIGVTNDRNNKGAVERQLRLPFFGEQNRSDTEVGMTYQSQLPLFRQQNRFDTEIEEFHRRVREGYLHLARSDPNRIKLIDASLLKEEIHQEIIRYVELLLQGQSLRTSRHQVKR